MTRRTTEHLSACILLAVMFASCATCTVASTCDRGERDCRETCNGHVRRVSADVCECMEVTR